MQLQAATTTTTTTITEIINKRHQQQRDKKFLKRNSCCHNHSIKHNLILFANEFGCKSVHNNENVCECECECVCACEFADIYLSRDVVRLLVSSYVGCKINT